MAKRKSDIGHELVKKKVKALLRSKNIKGVMLVICEKDGKMNAMTNGLNIGEVLYGRELLNLQIDVKIKMNARIISVKK